ncbi:aldehyde dehydrogenase family protein [Cnuibacter physcomitrellae]|uniref:aldehyde dehydrogenase family protein n=1 Tax=Cnuibacter physcomitrellae TaxID=1619308 RepID=UPI002175C971|nr:aldehyde dehydrogenase family protein [Cnuibacter physcomitrellae]MCS5498495.1 aldehyde dehydrogenase family protein [Cnuibacter physcomitrellae]
MTATVDLRHRIGGRWTDGSGEPVESWSPAHPERLVAAGRAAGDDELDAAVEAARQAASGWARMPAASRGAFLRGAGRLLAARADGLGAELAEEEGKTLAEGIGEVRRAAQILDYVSGVGDRVAGTVHHSPRPGERILVTRRPLGVIAAITPFNFPIAIPAWKIAPALAHGNTVVWKPADPVPLLALRLAAALVEAGLPDGVLNLLIGGPDLGRAMVAHPGIDGITFTGSTAVGRSIASAAAARGVPVQAELGGKNAAVVLADADLDLAVDQVAAGAFNSSGQKCTATSRIIVDESVADEFLARLVARADALVVGDPLDPATQVGPVISGRARESMLGAVAAASASGVTRLTSREPALGAAGDGHFVAPTVLDCTGTDAAVWDDELFGPIVGVKRVSGAAEAFAEANRGEFGLTAAMFTRDLGTALEAIEAIDTGILHVNSESAGADPHVPFGGAKGSGLGPKEQGEAAQDFFTHTTTVYLRGGA